jgi:8-oxo-dGTP pyrophosphatase MutT (NUDIX family)
MIDDVELNSLLDSTSKSFLISVEIRYCFSGENASFSHTLTYSGVKHMGITSILGNLLIGQDSTKWGLVDILNKPEDTAEIVVLKIAPGKEIPWHLHHIMRETEILLDFGLICQGIQVDFDSDSLRIWERKEPHCYVNRSINWKLVLCIDLPRFIFSDEVEIPNFSISSLNFKKTLSLPDVQTLVWKLNFRHGCFFSFPGGISAEKQLITMNIGYEQSQKIPHAVSACIIAMGNTFDSHEILLVRHSVRGWELPGGKVELNERATDALFRELSEESGFDMLGSGILSSDEASKITPMIQYFISSKASQDVHIKSIYGIKLSERPALPKSLDNETECSQFFNLQALMHGSLPELSSSLIKDLVFQICMKFSFVK